MPETTSDSKFTSRKTILLMLVYLTTSMANLVNQANTAVKTGPLGYLVWFTATSVFFGIPLMFLELSIGQFTGRNCIEIWKIKPCLSHIGYVVLIWQTIMLLYNHTEVTYILHYLMVTVQKPIPYYTCGSWANKNCNVIEKNYTINAVCIRGKRKWQEALCKNIYVSYPEYQYYRSSAINSDTISLSWRMYLTSWMVLVIVYCHNFKRLNSVKWFLLPFALYPFVGYFYLLIGSMRQKGLIEKYEYALDTTLSKFKERGRLTEIIHQVVYGLGLGNGVTFNLSSKSPFRTSCYVNAVLSVLISLFFTMLVVFTTGVMSCPFAYENVFHVVDLPLSFTFEKVPLMLKEYEHYTYFLIVNFSCQTMLGITSDVVLTFSLIETLMKMFPRIAKYPGAVYAVALSIFFVVTIPMLGPFARHIVASGYYRSMNIVSTYMIMFEVIIFVLWYGIDRLSEDVHFMQGIKPNKYIKISWACSTVILLFVICNELFNVVKNPRGLGDYIGFFTFVTTVFLTVVLTLVRVLIGIIKSKQEFWRMVSTDSRWGPKNKLLQRSRALFSAEAMTKEYIYRQYQLQAGIVARQKRANVRVSHDPQIISNIRAEPTVLQGIIV